MTSMHDYETGVNMTYLTMKEYKLTLSISFMVLTNDTWTNPHHKWFIFPCIDLIFLSLQDVVLESTIHSFLFENYHRQIVFARFNLQLSYPLLYEREVWCFTKTNFDHIRKTIFSMGKIVCKYEFRWNALSF